MKSLQRISVEKVSENLSSNYKLCLKKNIKVHKNVGDQIFDYSFKYRRPLRDEEVRFFKSDITELTEFCCSKGRFAVSNYDFLLGHRLEKFSLKDNFDFKIDCDNGQVWTKNFNLKINEYPDRQLESFMKKCLIVENSISVDFQENNGVLGALHHLIERSKSLKSLSIDCNDVDWNSLKKLFLKITDLKFLEEFKIQFYITDNDSEMLGDTLLHALTKTEGNLKRLFLPYLPFSYSALTGCLLKLSSLEELRIILRYSKDDSIPSGVVKALSLNQSLKKLYIQFDGIKENDLVAFSNVLRERTKLEKVEISSICFGQPEPKWQIILDSLQPSAKHLQSFDVWGMCGKQYIPNLNKILNCCHSLTNIHLINTCDDENFIFSVKQALKQSKNTLHKVFLTLFKGNNLASCLSELHGTKCLQYLDISRTEGNQESNDALRNLLESCKETLTFFSWSMDRKVVSTFDVKLLKSLANCSALIELHICTLNLNGKLQYLINESSAFQENLQILRLRSTKIDDEDVRLLGCVLKNFPSLTALDLNVFLSKDVMTHFRQQTQPLTNIVDGINMPSYFSDLSSDGDGNEDEEMYSDY